VTQFIQIFRYNDTWYKIGANVGLCLGNYHFQ